LNYGAKIEKSKQGTGCRIFWVDNTLSEELHERGANKSFQIFRNMPDG